MKKPKERTWDVWAAFCDGDLQYLYQPGTTKKDILNPQFVFSDGLLGGEELVRVRVTRL